MSKSPKTPKKFNNAPAKRKPKYRYYHPACSGTAFLLFEMPEKGSKISSSNAQHVDGRAIFPGEQITCDNCTWEITGLSVENVIPL